MILKYKFGLILLLLSWLMLGSCSATKDSEPVVKDELKEFRDWVNLQTAAVAERTEEDWKKSKADFQTRTAQLDQRQEDFSAEVKGEYQNLKEKFNSMAEKQAAQPARQVALPEWEQRLLGSYADYSTITQQNLREAYSSFMENVRNQRINWVKEDWEMAKLVLEQLKTRKHEIDNGLDTDTEVKIKALEMEFRTLETGADLGGN